MKVKVGSRVVHIVTNSIGKVFKIVRNEQCLLEAHVRLDNGGIVSGSATLGDELSLRRTKHQLMSEL